MVCKKCGKDIPASAAFCLYCGEAVASVRKFKDCPQCGTVREANMIYCHKCGTLLKAVSITGQELYRLRLISKYEGEPKVGIAKGTGDLVIYDDRIEFVPVIGNAIGSAFGAIGRMVMDRIDSPKADVYQMSSVQEAVEGKYAGLMPMVILRLKNGNTFSFASVADLSGVIQAVQTIEKYKMFI